MSEAHASAADAVSEIIGQILVFGILSMVLVLSMYAFGVASESAEERGARLQAEGVTQQVASVVVEASLFIEARPAGTTYQRVLDLPDDIEQSGYEIHLEPANTHQVCQRDGTTEPNPDWVRIVLTRFDDEPTGSCLENPVFASVFSAGAPANVEICESTSGGGDLEVRYDTDPSDPTSNCLFIEGD